jgi:hypothetical protein
MLTGLSPGPMPRVLLGAALTVKAVAWFDAPPGLRLLLLAAGLCTVSNRHAPVALTASAAVIGLILATGIDYANHLYLLGLMCALGALAFVGHPVGRIGQCLMGAQVSITYFWAAVWKLNLVFLTGSVLAVEWERSWLLGSYLPRGALTIVCAVITIVGELLLAVGLWSPGGRGRAVVVPLGAILHAGMILTIGEDLETTLELVVFALLCMTVYPFHGARSSTSRAHGRVDGAGLADSSGARAEGASR